MGRAAREFAPAEVKRMIALFEAGESLERIGRRQTPLASAHLIGRLLQPHLGNLKHARARVTIRLRLERLKQSKEFQAGYREGSKKGYPEGFEAGCRMALTWVNLYGMEQTQEHCDRTLLPWRDQGLDGIPPEFLRIHRKDS